jgi:hypothetical protein
MSGQPTPTTSFRVSSGPHGWVWWTPGEVIPSSYQSRVRAATEPEIDLMRRILNADGHKMPASLIARLGRMMEQTLV